MQTDFYGKLPSLKFVVKNVSPQRKTITIFNLSIPFGRSVDLLALPDVSEGDIRSSLAKGELANKIRVGDIQIVASTIDLVQFDPNQEAFINSANIDPGVPVEGTELPVGPQGVQGAVGPQGAVGAQGNAGAQGDTGPQGNVGSTGQGFVIAQVFNSVAELLAGSVPDGEFGLVAGTLPPTDPDYGKLYLYSGGIWAYQTDMSVQGILGPQGDVGAQGSQGSQGATGPAPAGTGLVYTTSGTPSVITDGSAGQVLTVSGGAPVWSGGASARPAIDANHTDVWYMDSTDGTSFPNAVSGRSALSGGSNLTVQNGGCYKNYPSAVWTGTSGVSVQVSSSDTIPVSQIITLEAIVVIPNFAKSNENNYPNFAGTVALYGSTDFMDMRINDVNRGNIPSFNGFRAGGLESFTDGIYPGGGRSQISLQTPHHIMLVWNPGVRWKVYFDGFVFVDFAGIGPRANVMSPAVIFYEGMYVADFRISNIERPRSYAQAAVRAMRAM